MATFALYGLGYFGLFNLPHPQEIQSAPNAHGQGPLASAQSSFTHRISAEGKPNQTANHSKLTDRVSEKAS